MATTQEYIDFVCEQIRDCGAVRYRKMFGDYMVYVNDKPLLLVCDNSVYVKKLPMLDTLMQDAPCGVPYEGSKEHYLLDIENTDLAHEVIALIEPIVPVPKPRKKS